MNLAPISNTPDDTADLDRRPRRFDPPLRVRLIGMTVCGVVLVALLPGH